MHNFSVNPIINITRSRFRRPHKHSTTFNAGEVVPIDVDEVLPGDTRKLTTNAVIRMSTPIKPVMDNAFADIMHFFIPCRLLWEHWEEFNGANNSGPWAQETEYNIPQTISPANTGWTKGTIADHMGIPTNVPNLSVNSLPFRAYVKVWNDWFRDENLQNFAYLTTDDSTTTGTNGSDIVQSAITGGKCLPCAKVHDYFTSALPEPQKGPDVLLPLGDTAPVMGNGTTLGLTDGKNNLGLKASSSDSNSYTILYKSIYGTPIGTAITGSNNDEARPGYTAGITTDPTKSGMVADLSNATAATINQLRQAFQLQKMFEKDARGGTRYIEIIKNHFGVTSSDARLQRSEYLGGKRVPITVTQVLQTSSTDATSPQGNTAAYSLTVDSSDSYTKSFEEHGYLLTVVMVRTMHTYQQGLNKLWSRKTRTDFYMPVFANIGEQPILNKEIYAQGTAEDDEVFGYQEAWADYRYKPNMVTGEFRSNYAENGGLDIWHYADYYSSLPTLGSDWIAETKNNIDRTLAVQSNVADQFIADFWFEEIATRPMPVYSIPGLIDHH